MSRVFTALTVPTREGLSLFHCPGAEALSLPDTAEANSDRFRDFANPRLSTVGAIVSLIAPMGQEQRHIDELARLEQLCRDLAAESKVLGEAEALREMAGNYGREAAVLAVARTVDCSRRKRKLRPTSIRVTGHPFRQCL